MSYIYCNAKDEDKENIYKLYRTVMKEFISKIWGWDESWQKNDFLSHFNANETTLVLINGQLVGYCQAEEKANYFFLRMVAIIPEHQCKGIGKVLLKSLKDKCINQSKTISLEVFKINKKAKDYYKKNGFSVIGEKEHSYIMELNA